MDGGLQGLRATLSARVSAEREVLFCLSVLSVILVTF